MNQVDQDTTAFPFPRPGLFQISAEFHRLRTEAPVAVVTLPSGDRAYLVTRHEQARAVLADQRLSRNLSRPDAARLRIGQETFSNETGGVFGEFAKSIADPPGHTRWRALVGKAFAARRIAGMRPRVEQIVDELLDAVAADAPPVDLMSRFCFALPITVICELLGVPAGDRERFEGWVKKAVSNVGQSWAEAGAAMGSLVRYAQELIEVKREQGGQDLISHLIRVHDENEQRLSTEELVNTILMLLIAGYESTAVQLGNGLLALFTHPDQLARLRADPGLIPTAVEEILRFAQLGTRPGVARYATTDIPLGDVVVPQGATVLVAIESGNRDPEVFGADADRFDVGRDSARHHLSFSAGPTFCSGAALARMELEVALGALLTRFPGLRAAEPIEEIELRHDFVTSSPSRLLVAW